MFVTSRSHDPTNWPNSASRSAIPGAGPGAPKASRTAFVATGRSPDADEVDNEHERLVGADHAAGATRAVELLAVRPRHADVVDLDVVTCGRLGAVTDDDVVDHQVGGRCGRGDGHLGLGHAATLTRPPGPPDR